MVLINDSSQNHVGVTYIHRGQESPCSRAEMGIVTQNVSARLAEYVMRSSDLT